MGELFLSMVIGSVGLGLFIYGKKQARLPQVVTGFVLMLYPYFVPNGWVMLAIAVALLGVLWLVVRFGK